MSKSRTSRIHEQRGTTLLFSKESAASDWRIVQVLFFDCHEDGIRAVLRNNDPFVPISRTLYERRRTFPVEKLLLVYEQATPDSAKHCRHPLLSDFAGSPVSDLHTVWTTTLVVWQTDRRFSSSLMKLKCFETPAATFHFSWASNVVDMFNGCFRGPHVSYSPPVYTCFSQGVSRYQIWRGGDWWHSMGRFPICIGVSLRWTMWRLASVNVLGATSRPGSGQS